jgi:hypothetical protein
MAHARTRYFSLKKQYPELYFIVALCDSITGLDEQPFTVIDIEQLNMADLRSSDLPLKILKILSTQTFLCQCYYRK